MENIIYKANSFSVFQNVLYDTMEEAINCTVGNIELVQDKNTGFIYNRAFNASLVDYTKKYNNEQSNSVVFREHLYDVKSIIERYMGKSKLLEIGCGKGYFLDYLLSHDFNIIGTDTTYEGNSPNIKKEYYNKDTQSEFNGIIMRHVLEHIEEPYSFLKDIKEANNENGLIYIEVPCLDWINNNNSFIDIFYEHVNYFRAIDFQNMFDSIVDIGHAFGGQYLYIVAKLSSLKKPVIKDKFTLSKTFSNKLLYYKHLILNSKKKIIIWGTTSKGVILSLLLKKLYSMRCQKMMLWFLL